MKEDTAMAIDFQTRRINFSRHTTSPQQGHETFVFPTRVNKANAALAGSNFVFEGDDHPVHEQRIEITQVRLDNNTVIVSAEFAFRDHTGVFDDPFSGWAD